MPLESPLLVKDHVISVTREKVVGYLMYIAHFSFNKDRFAGVLCIPGRQ